MEQQKNLKKLEQQNKLLREQLAASKKKDGTSSKGGRGGRKPRNLFPDAALIEVGFEVLACYDDFSLILNSI